MIILKSTHEAICLEKDKLIGHLKVQINLESKARLEMNQMNSFLAETITKQTEQISELAKTINSLLDVSLQQPATEFVNPPAAKTQKELLTEQLEIAEQDFQMLMLSSPTRMTDREKKRTEIERLYRLIDDLKQRIASSEVKPPLPDIPIGDTPKLT